MNTPQTQKLRKPIIMKPSFWYMRDNHTFYKPQGKNIEEIKNDYIRLAKENPYGMVCPVVIVKGKKETEVTRVGPCAHVDGDGNVDLSYWFEEIMKNDIISSYNIT